MTASEVECYAREPRLPYTHERCCSASGHWDKIPEIINLGEKVRFNSVMEGGSVPWPAGLIAFEPLARQDSTAGAGSDGNYLLPGS